MKLQSLSTKHFLELHREAAEDKSNQKIRIEWLHTADLVLSKFPEALRSQISLSFVTCFSYLQTAPANPHFLHLFSENAPMLFCCEVPGILFIFLFTCLD